MLYHYANKPPSTSSIVAVIVVLGVSDVVAEVAVFMGCRAIDSEVHWMQLLRSLVRLTTLE